MKKTIFILAALVAVPLCISLSSCSSDSNPISDEVTPPPPPPSPGTTVVVSTFAGSDKYGGDNDGTGSEAQFGLPTGITIDVSGNLYVTDAYNHRIRKITPAGVVTTLAGSTAGYADGTKSDARFYDPEGITIDKSGNLYVADAGNNRIRKVTPAGVVTTLAGSGRYGDTDATGGAAEFTYPTNIAVDALGNLYVSDYYNHRIRKVTPTGVVTTLAGSSSGYADGTGSAAQFYFPDGIAIDASGNLYVADIDNSCIRKVTSTGVVTTFVGSTTGGYADGTGSEAQFAHPTGIAIDKTGNLYVVDTYNERIRKVTPDGVVTTLAGSGTQGYLDGVGDVAEFFSPLDIAIDASGNLYVADYWNHCIRKIEFK